MIKNYVLMSGQIKNVGDFIITDRAIKLFEKFIGKNYIIILRDKPLSNEEIVICNNSLGVIILGGRGFRKNMFPETYPFILNLSKKIPIFTLGSGGRLKTGSLNEINNNKFSVSTMKVLKKHQNNNKYGYGVRDYITFETAKKNGIKTIMTGCPVWYNLDKINHQLESKKIEHIVFTPPQDPIYEQQCILIMDFIKKQFPKTKVDVCFHRGIEDIDDSTKADMNKNVNIKNHGIKLGWNCIDVSGALSKIKFYDDSDLHIGYRVHGHIYFLSNRKKSFLINEDSRGLGACSALGCDILNGFNEKGNINENLVKELEQAFLLSKANDYNNFNENYAVIDSTLKIMENYLLEIKNYHTFRAKLRRIFS